MTLAGPMTRDLVSAKWRWRALLKVLEMSLTGRTGAAPEAEMGDLRAATPAVLTGCLP